MNWLKVSANGGTAFFTTLAATYLTGLANIDVSLIAAMIQSGLAFFAEMKIESEQPLKKLAIGLLI